MSLYVICLFSYVFVCVCMFICIGIHKYYTYVYLSLSLYIYIYICSLLWKQRTEPAQRISWRDAVRGARWGLEYLDVLRYCLASELTSLNDVA